jgi:hypothetical protein
VRSFIAAVAGAEAAWDSATAALAFFEPSRRCGAASGRCRFARLTSSTASGFEPDNTDNYERIETLSLAFFICIMILTVYLFTVEMI